jgi:myo-inositol-1(or 4)-monophosphatase
MPTHDRWSQEELERLSAVAVDAARVGAEVVRRAAAHDRPPSERKGSGDYVTRVDRDSEAAIMRILEERAPKVPVLGEETGGEPAERYWAVDPLDGTTNFLIGFPVVDVSIALIEAGRPVVGAVELPLLHRSYLAVRGGGAWAGERRLAVSDRPPGRAIVATALPFRRRERVAGYLDVLSRVFEEIEDVRRAGAAAADLAWVAEGVFDGYFELGLGTWDVAAGALLVEEAGGVVTDWEGGVGYLSGNVIAASPDTHAALLGAIRRGQVP